MPKPNIDREVRFRSRPPPTSGIANFGRHPASMKQPASTIAMPTTSDRYLAFSYTDEVNSRATAPTTMKTDTNPAEVEADTTSARMTLARCEPGLDPSRPRKY